MLHSARIAPAFIVVLLAAAGAVDSPDARPSAPRHVVVWREAGRYGGWPANHGIWSWGDEILVGFSAGYMQPAAIGSGGPARHPIDRTRPEQHLLARSTDGGEHWRVEHPAGLVPPPTTGHMAGVPTEEGGRRPQRFEGVPDLTNPDLAMTFRMGRRGDPLQPQIGERKGTPPGASAIGRREEPRRSGVVDLGRTWSFAATAVADTGRGNPPSLIRLRDGRLVITYGYRAQPFGIRATISRDGGRTWDAPRVLREDARDWDLGYPRSVQRRDGRIVTVYYHNDVSAPERYIAATLWDAAP